MISRLSHSTIWCFDQEQALTFYRDVLGFAVRSDQTMGDFRWLTVSPPDQSDLEMVRWSSAREWAWTRRQPPSWPTWSAPGRWAQGCWRPTT